MATPKQVAFISPGHTGKHAVYIPFAGNAPGFSNNIHLTADISPANFQCDDTQPNTPEYELTECDCTGKFQPTAGKRYLLRFWTKSRAYEFGASNLDYESELDVDIQLGGNSITLDPSRTSKLIDGWQKWEISFTINANQGGNAFDLYINNNSTGIEYYLDDLSIHPWHGDMQTYVYDNTTLRLLASLNANGYATMYQYDWEGNVTGIRIETEEGIQTVQEGRQELIQTPNQ